MSYDPSIEVSATYAAYLNSTSYALPNQAAPGYVEFIFDQALGACSATTAGVIVCQHPVSTATVDITTSANNTLNIFNYGFTNGTYRTASAIRNEYSKGDDVAFGGFVRETSIKVDTGVFFRSGGVRNVDGLDQLVGVIL